MGDETDKFSNLYFLIQYRRKDDGIRWINMAAFDGALAAERYFKSQDTDANCRWEYQMLDLENGTTTRQCIPQERGEQSNG